MSSKSFVRAFLLAAGYALVNGRARAQSASELSKQVQNPVGSLISMPLQVNFFTGGGIRFDNTLVNINFQPVIPLHLTPKWTLIARSIVPWFDIPLADFVHESGIGDIQQQFLFTPVKKGDIKFTWGAGPILSFPTATNDLVRTGAWAAGPGLVLVFMPRNFVIGTLAYNLWTFGNNDEDEDVNLLNLRDPLRNLPSGHDINALTLQPFVNLNFPNGWAMTYAPIISANWDAPDDDVWTVPLGLGLSKVNQIGRTHVNLSLEYYANVERPRTLGNNHLRFFVGLLYPATRPAAAADKDK